MNLLYFMVASRSKGRLLALGSKGPGFNVESSGKALYMHVLAGLRCKMSTQLQTVEDLVRLLD